MKSKYELYLGDCINVLQELVDKGYSVDCIITDPPYGVTSCKWDTVLPLEKVWNLIHKISKETANIILFSQQPYTTTLNYSNIKEFRYELIWKKQQCTYPMCAKQRVMPIHENTVFAEVFISVKSMLKSLSNTLSESVCDEYIDLTISEKSKSKNSLSTKPSHFS